MVFELSWGSAEYAAAAWSLRAVAALRSMGTVDAVQQRLDEVHAYACEPFPSAVGIGAAWHEAALAAGSEGEVALRIRQLRDAAQHLAERWEIDNFDQVSFVDEDDGQSRWRDLQEGVDQRRPALEPLAAAVVALGISGGELQEDVDASLSRWASERTSPTSDVTGEALWQLKMRFLRRVFTTHLAGALLDFRQYDAPTVHWDTPEVAWRALACTSLEGFDALDGLGESLERNVSGERGHMGRDAAGLFDAIEVLARSGARHADAVAMASIAAGISRAPSGAEALGRRWQRQATALPVPPDVAPSDFRRFKLAVARRVHETLEPDLQAARQRIARFGLNERDPIGQLIGELRRVERALEDGPLAEQVELAWRALVPLYLPAVHDPVLVRGGLQDLALFWAMREADAIVGLEADLDSGPPPVDWAGQLAEAHDEDVDDLIWLLWNVFEDPAEPASVEGLLAALTTYADSDNDELVDIVTKVTERFG